MEAFVDSSFFNELSSSVELQAETISTDASTKQYFSNQLHQLLVDNNLDIHCLDIEQLRNVVSDFLQDVLLEVKTEMEK